MRLLVAIVLAVILIATAVGAFVYMSAGGGFGGRNVTVAGHVLAGANGMVPVANAVVYIAGGSGPGSGPTAEVTTDVTGSYTYVGEGGATYTLWATLGTHWGSVTGPFVTRTLPMVASTATVDLTVPASDITGTVTDRTSGIPVAGATISLADPSGSWWCCYFSEVNGGYLLWAITQGMYAISAAASGYNSTTVLAYVSSTATSVQQDLVLGFGAGGLVLLTGRVLAGDNDTVPVANAVVHIAVGPAWTTDVIADTTGSYRFDAQTSTTYTIWPTLGVSWGVATGPSVTQNMPLTPTTVVLNLTVPASDIRGTVTNRTTGYPIPGASMRIADPSGSWWCCQSTDANGSYLLWTITAGTYTLSAAASRYNSTTFTVYVSSTATTVVLDFSLS